MQTSEYKLGVKRKVQPVKVNDWLRKARSTWQASCDNAAHLPTYKSDPYQIAQFTDTQTALASYFH